MRGRAVVFGAIVAGEFALPVVAAGVVTARSTAGTRRGPPSGSAPTTAASAGPRAQVVCADGAPHGWDGSHPGAAAPE